MAGRRIVLHVDVNSAFLSWTAREMLRQGETLDIRTVAAVVGGDETSRHGIVLAKSEKAKACGIHTGEPLYSAREKCRDLLVVSSQYSLYSEASNELYVLLCDYSPLIQRYSIDECFLEYTGMEGICGAASDCAEEIRYRCETELGFTVNVGVGNNKLLAKMAGELRKPNRVNTLFSEEIQQKLWPLPVRELFMVGRQTEKVLSERGIRTVGALAQTDPKLLRHWLKSHGVLVWSYANGIDASPVVPNATVAPKSYSNAATMPQDVTERTFAHRALRPLCESVMSRMRKDGYAARLIGVQIKYSDFSVVQHQRALPQATTDTKTVFSHLVALFDALWDGKSIRLLGARLGELCIPEAEQLTFDDGERLLARAALDAATDEIRKKYGRRSLIPATMLLHDFSQLDRYAPGSTKPRTNSPF